MTGFYGSNGPTNSVKALKEDTVIRYRLQSHRVHPAVTVTQHMQYEKINAKYTDINTDESNQSEMGQDLVRQKPNA